MATRFIDADIHGLYVLAELVDKFWRKPSPRLAREIRLLGQPYGLNPLDRRRLEWTIGEGDQESGGRRRIPQTSIEPEEDPRRVLHMVAKASHEG